VLIGSIHICRRTWRSVMYRLLFFCRRSSVGTFIRPHSSSSSFSDTRPHQSAAPKLDYRSMVSVDDMPELFVSFDSKYSWVQFCLLPIHYGGSKHFHSNCCVMCIISLLSVTFKIYVTMCEENKTTWHMLHLRLIIQCVPLASSPGKCWCTKRTKVQYICMSYL
jgi:hypothetical protein